MTDDADPNYVCICRAQHLRPVYLLLATKITAGHVSRAKNKADTNFYSFGILHIT